jgi:uncharacterized protein (TIGR03435 family)
MEIRRGSVAAATVAAGICVLGQANARAQPAPRTEFEVATVRQSPPPPGDLIDINLGTLRNGRLTFANASLSDCLKFAWQIVSDDQISGPDWIKSKAVRFDIVAQAPPDTPRDRLSLMLQALLADRLKLVLHHERKTLPFLALVTGRNGSKLSKPSDANNSGGNIAARGRITANHMSMQGLVTLLSRFERQAVVDMTGLQGEFAFHLEWMPEAGGTAAATDIPSGPSIFTAVEEQLGLKLESRKAPLDVLVVDHAEKVPTEN